MSIVQYVFTAGEVKLVCPQPLSVINSEDERLWIASSNGLFTVRSAYYLMAFMCALVIP